ncbi:TIR domain-containing protein [bacterium]|nr:TIR domain-containing protein [bacterium]
MTAPEPRVFVSFSSDDREEVRRLLARLQAQPLNVWNYADEPQEIPGGASLPDYLCNQINRSDYFVPMVSANALNTRYAKLEVEHALVRRAEHQLQIIPVAVAGCPPDEQWEPPYRELATIRRREADLLSPEELDALVQELCRDMRVDYVPRPNEDPRLPFMLRFDDEIRGLRARHAEHDRAVFTRLMNVRDEFVAAYEAGDFLRARARAAFFVAMCEYEFPQAATSIYYPYVVRAVCESSCGDLRQARETLMALLNHPSVDENTYGALGYVARQEGSYQEALALYREAMRLDPADPAARTWVVLLSILCGEPAEEVERVFADIDEGRIVLAGDRMQVRALRAFAYANEGRYADAAHVLGELVRREEVTADIVVDYAVALGNLDQPTEALGVLESHCEQFHEANFWHHLASLNLELGHLDRAVDCFTELVAMAPHVRQYRADAALAYWCADLDCRVRETVSPILDLRVFALPEEPEDFYLDGFANWFLDQTERAEYDFQRSGYSSDKHYREVLSDWRRAFGRRS